MRLYVCVRDDLPDIVSCEVNLRYDCFDAGKSYKVGTEISADKSGLFGGEPWRRKSRTCSFVLGRYVKVSIWRNCKKSDIVN